MNAQRITVKTTLGVIDIEQVTIGKWRITYNPDDGRFYVSDNDQGIATTTFNRLRNAIQYARKHAE